MHAALVPHQPKLRALKRELQPSTPVVREQSPPVSQARIDESRDSPLAPTHQLVSPPAPAEQRSPAPAVMTAPVTATDLPPELPVGAEEQEQPPGVESTPIAPPSVATPERRLANAVVDELREILRQDPNIVGDPRLELIEVRELDDDALACVVGDSVVLGAAHPIVGAALRGEPLDPLLVAFLASAVYTAVNTWLEEITDEHEARFIAAHAARASRALAPNH